MLRRFSALICLTLSVNATVAEEVILERLDHFLALSDRPAELFAVFNETLKLPAAWPYEVYDGFASGGVSVGGSVLEVITYTDFGGKARFSAIAFLPANHIPKVRRQLERNDVALGPNDPYTVTEDGESHVLWENFDILNVSSPNLRVFVCDYKSREYLEENRSTARNRLADADGGPLGVVGLAEIQIGALDVEAKRAEWSKLGLQQLSATKFSVANGSIISVVEAPGDSILAIALRVKSVNAAADWLAQQGILGSRSGKSAQIASDALQGLFVFLVE